MATTRCVHPTRCYRSLRDPGALNLTATTFTPSRPQNATHQTLEREHVDRVDAARPLPAFRAGDVLEVTVSVPELERRKYVYRGVCVARANRGPRSWFKVFNVFPDIGGFVQHFPL